MSDIRASDEVDEVEIRPSSEAPHSCQPPQTDLPPPGQSWVCPECGRAWRHDDVSEDPERGGPAQRVYWSAQGDPPPPKNEPPPPVDVEVLDS
jgi:hypothetical protein